MQACVAGEAPSVKDEPSLALALAAESCQSTVLDYMHSSLAGSIWDGDEGINITHL